MLYRLEVENFFSILDRQVIDLRIADNAPDLPDRFVPIYDGAKERVPKVVAFFGANASGKTNLLRVIDFLCQFLLEGKVWPPAFASEAGASGRTSFAFEVGGKALVGEEFGAYRYEIVFGLTEGGGFERPIVSETLDWRGQGKSRWSALFDRSNDSVKGSKDFPLSGLKAFVDKLPRAISLVTHLARIDHGAARRISASIQNVKRALTIGGATQQVVAGYYATKPDMLRKMGREIQRIDLGIRQIDILPGKDTPYLAFQHQGLNRAMSYFEQSDGTRRFLTSIPFILESLEIGGLVVVDELDVAIHPGVLPEIVRWFHDLRRNPSNAQIWMSCHAATLLDELEKEEVFFCEKDAEGRTSVYGLQDIKGLRRNELRARKYLGGFYGAVPSIG